MAVTPGSARRGRDGGGRGSLPLAGRQHPIDWERLGHAPGEAPPTWTPTPDAPEGAWRTPAREAPAKEATPASARQLSASELVLQRLDWTVIRRLDGLLQGDYRSLFRGNGVDLAGLREYQPGDDVRYIDWNVTARLDTAYVREYNEDREITAWFLLDLSPSMDFGSVAGERLKRSVLVDFVATMARVLTRRGNRVGALIYGDGIVRVPARVGRDQVLRLIEILDDQPRLARAPLTDLEPMLSAAEHAIRRRSLVFVLSDFIAAPGWERPLAMLNRRHEVVSVRLQDPRETDLPAAGTLVMEDSETGEQIVVNTGDRGFRRRFEEAVQAREERVTAAFTRAGVEALSLSTGDDLVRSIVRMTTLRKKRRK